MLVAVVVVGGIIQSMTDPKPRRVMPVDPQTAREQAEAAAKPVSVEHMCDDLGIKRSYGYAKDEFAACMEFRDNLRRAARGE
jgi:hypothetical protein